MKNVAADTDTSILPACPESKPAAEARPRAGLLP